MVWKVSFECVDKNGDKVAADSIVVDVFDAETALRFFGYEAERMMSKGVWKNVFVTGVNVVRRGK